MATVIELAQLAAREAYFTQNSAFASPSLTLRRSLVRRFKFADDLAFLLAQLSKLHCANAVSRRFTSVGLDSIELRRRLAFF